jgi:transcriptional regulator with XRE-family HTH domain
MGTRPLATGPRTAALAAFISYAMEEVGMSRVQLEGVADISHNRLAVLLRGERPMTVEELSRICAALGMRPSRALDAVEEALEEPGEAAPAGVADLAAWGVAAQVTDADPLEEADAVYGIDPDAGEESQETPWDD